MFVEPNHQTTGRRKIRKKKVPVIHTLFIMDNPEYPDNSMEVNLQDVITGEEFTLQLSPKSALKAKTDLSFATLLLNVARQACVQNSACEDKNCSTIEASEHVQTTSLSNTSLKEVFDNMGMSTEGREMEEDDIEETSLTENKENFRWSHAAIMLLLEEYRVRESSMSSGKMSHKKAWDEIARVMNVKGYDVSGKQCMTSINTMKRTYKTVKDHNGRSGNNKRTWKYYDAMESLLGRKPYMEPLTTISSSGSVTSRPERPDSQGKRKATDQPAIIQTLIEKRQKAEEEKAKRHKERMEMGNKMLAKLDKLLEKK